MASLDIAYAFRDDQAKAEYIAQLALYRPISFHKTFERSFPKSYDAKVLGRTLLDTEFKPFSRSVERYGSASRVERIAKSFLDSDMLAPTQEKGQVNIMFLAMLRLQGLTPPPIRSLSSEVQADVKMLWPNYKSAIQAGLICPSCIARKYS